MVKIKILSKQAINQASKQASKISQLTAYGGTCEGLPQLKLHTIN